MKRSAQRILTTHVGSLPRAPELWRDAAGLPAQVLRIVERQRAAGIDIVSDGELGKPGFIHYVNSRLSGFAERKDAASVDPWAGSREALTFGEYYASLKGDPHHSAVHLDCVGPIGYRGQAELARDIANLKAAMAAAGATEAFMPAVSPTNVETWQRNRYYKTQEEYLFAIASAMGEEYRTIAAAGLVLQVDDPRLVTQYNLDPKLTLADCRRWVAVRVEALNHALAGIPQEQVRFHTCYSIDAGPRVHDMALEDIVDLILQVRAGAYSFEAANPRHEHEWRVWERVRLPEGKILIPGVITQSTVLVEHPDLVAERIERFARVVGRENVIAGADCGFASFAGRSDIHESIVWAKLSALAEGARRASARLR